MSTLVAAMDSAGALVGEKAQKSKACSEDAERVARARQGDSSAFRELVGKYRRLAHHTAYGFVRDEHLARDLSQEAFVRVFRNLHRYNPRLPFASWLRRITVNLAIDELRRQKRRPETPLQEDVGGPGSPDPARAAEVAEEKQAVWEILEGLPLKYRTVMTLREIEGLSTEEVSKIVKRPAVSVRWRLHRARQMFRERWLARYGEA